MRLTLAQSLIYCLETGGNMKLVLAILLAATVSVAQHQQGNVANVPGSEV